MRIHLMIFNVESVIFFIVVKWIKIWPTIISIFRINRVHPLDTSCSIYADFGILKLLVSGGLKASQSLSYLFFSKMSIRMDSQIASYLLFVLSIPNLPAFYDVIISYLQSYIISLIILVCNHSFFHQW